MLDESQIASCIEYNERQGFSDHEVRSVQQLLGVAASGSWDAATVRAVFDWQSREGLPPDGKIWRDLRGNTWPRLLPLLRLPEPRLRVGMWIDDAPGQVLADAYVPAVRELGIDVVGFMVNRANTRATDPDWQLSWSLHELLTAADRFRGAGVDVVYTFWPRPRATQIDRLLGFASQLVAQVPPNAIEVDTEGNWTKTLVQGFDSLSEAGRELALALRDVAPAGARLELTTYPYHSEFVETPTVAQYVDALLPQAYSVGSQGQSWDGANGPGKLQRTALGLAKRVKRESDGAAPEIVCGLAAYSQEFAGHTPEEAMKIALDAAVDAGLREVRYWSSKWIVGHRKNGYSEAFVRKTLQR